MGLSGATLKPPMPVDGKGADRRKRRAAASFSLGVARRDDEDSHECTSAQLHAVSLRAERGSILSNFSAHADGERRGLDRIGG